MSFFSGCTRCLQNRKKVSIEHIERKLRAYFAQSRYLSPEVWGPPHVMQAVVEACPSELARRTLFPPCLPASLLSTTEDDTSNSTTTSEGRSAHVIERKPDDTLSQEETPAPPTSVSLSSSSLVSGGMSLWPSHENGLSLYASRRWKARDPRFLSNRFCNPLESCNDYGLSEVGIAEIWRSVHRVWNNCERGWKEVMKTFSTASLSPQNGIEGDSAEVKPGNLLPLCSPHFSTSTTTACTTNNHIPPFVMNAVDNSTSTGNISLGVTLPSMSLPERVLFLVLFSTTRHQVGSGDILHRIGREVKYLIEHPDHIHYFSHIFRVVVVLIGVQSTFSCCPTSSSSSLHTAGGCNQGPLPFSPLQPGATCEDMEVIQFPHAGLYTFQGVLTCFSSLTPVPARYGEMSAKTNEGRPSVVQATLRPSVYVVSDGWLQPRSCIHGCRTPDCHMAVLPAVISNTLSTKEVKAFSRYIACMNVQRPHATPIP